MSDLPRQFVEFMGSPEEDPFNDQKDPRAIYNSELVQQAISLSNIDIFKQRPNRKNIELARLFPEYSNYPNPESRFTVQHFLSKQYENNVDNDFASNYIQFIYSANSLESRVKPQTNYLVQVQIDELFPDMSQELRYIFTPERQIELIKAGNFIKEGHIDISEYATENDSHDLGYQLEFINKYVQSGIRPEVTKNLVLLAEGEFRRIAGWESSLGNMLLDTFSIVLDQDPERLDLLKRSYASGYTGGSTLSKNSPADFAFRYLHSTTEQPYMPDVTNLAEILVHNMSKLGGKETFVVDGIIIKISDLFITQMQAINLISDIEYTLAEKGSS
jgi:hypothetical protein